jgi:hypothetical protein
MKMNRQNPGGEIATRPTMKGCEKYMAEGKGSIPTNYAGAAYPGTKGSLKAPGLKGWVPAGKARGK